MKIPKDLFDTHVDCISLNANDVFGPACADSVEVDIYDLPELIETYKFYGDDGIIAFMGKIRKADPWHDSLKTEKYYKAKVYLEDYVLFEDLDTKNGSEQYRVYIDRLRSL